MPWSVCYGHPAGEEGALWPRYWEGTSWPRHREGALWPRHREGALWPLQRENRGLRRCGLATLRRRLGRRRYIVATLQRIARFGYTAVKESIGYGDLLLYWKVGGCSKWRIVAILQGRRV